MSIFGIVLAAGQGKRMKSKLYKVLHPVCGKPMVGHVADVLRDMGAHRTVVVVGHGADAVKSYLGERVEYALQEQQLGTGHAVLQAAPLLGDQDGLTVVLCGDTPLISPASLQQMIALFKEQQAAAAIMTAVVEQPQGYGRVIRGEAGHVERIVEQKDCSEAEEQVTEINAGVYCFDNRKLFQALQHIRNDNAQQEYYFTDVFAILRRQGESIAGYCVEDVRESIGVNDRIALAEAELFMRERILHRHMRDGVTIIDPANTYIGADVEIGIDTTIYPGTHLAGRTAIGEDCSIGPNSEIVNATIADGVQVKQSVLHDCRVDSETTIGPFAYIRPGAEIGKRVKIGDFVEIKNASIAEGSKISHLSYVGDAKVGRNVNIGCGAITVNYDGYNKHITEIGDEAFIGSNVNLIAPLQVGDSAYVVAGSTVTHDVPAGDLAIARERQTNKPGYADKVRSKFKAMKQNQ